MKRRSVIQAIVGGVAVLVGFRPATATSHVPPLDLATGDLLLPEGTWRLTYSGKGEFTGGKWTQVIQHVITKGEPMDWMRAVRFCFGDDAEVSRVEVEEMPTITFHNHVIDNTGNSL